MNKFDILIHGLKKDAEVPKAVWKSYTDTLSRLPDKQKGLPSRTRVQKKLWPVAAAAALVIGAATISTAAYLNWSQGLEKVLQTTPEQRQLLEENQSSSFIGQSVTQNGVTITARQSIADNYAAYLFFTVEGYEIPDGAEPGFSGIALSLGDDEPYAGSWSAQFYDGLVPDGTPLGEGETGGYTLDDGSMEFLVTLMTSEKGAFLGKPIHVEFSDLGTYNEKAGDITVDKEGSWSFDWVLTGSQAMESYELNAALGNSGATVFAAELSPISISVTYEFPRQEFAETAAYTTYAAPPAFTGFRLKDGTIRTGLPVGAVSGYPSEDSDIYEYTASFGQAVDVEEVESLLFLKSSPEDGQDFSEEHFYFLPVA